MNAAWSFLSSLALKLIGPILAYLKGRADSDLKHKEKELENAEAEKKLYSDASVATTVDAIRELRERAEAKRKKRDKS